MIGEALVPANDFIKTPGWKTDLHERVLADMHAYWRFTEFIVRMIQHQHNLARLEPPINRASICPRFVCLCRRVPAKDR